MKIPKELRPIVRIANTTPLKRENQSTHPVREFHPVLILNSKRALYQVPVDDKEAYDKEAVRPIQRDDEPHRKVFSVAGDPQFASTESTASFAILPIKAEPNSSSACCYLIHAQRLNPVNPWTEAAWSDHPDHKKAFDVPADNAARARVVLATTGGEILDVVARSDGSAAVTALDPKEHAEIWRLLRNGCVVGQAAVGAGVLPLVNLAAFDVPKGPLTEARTPITGTLDFKWPANKKLKVAVMDPAERNLVEVVSRMLTLWTTKTNLSFKMVDAKEESYDILINLQKLPQTIRESESRDAQTISYPFSDLGSYATRRRLNDATLFAGWPPGLKDEGGKEFNSEREYFESKAFKHILIHELGHALGLPHLHQCPSWHEAGRDPLFDSVTKVAEQVKTHMGITMTENFLQEHFLLAWPGDPHAYSEWPMDELKVLTPKEAASHSVMMGLPIQAILADSEDMKLVYHDAPQLLDLLWIRRLYPERRS